MERACVLLRVFVVIFFPLFYAAAGFFFKWCATIVKTDGRSYLLYFFGRDGPTLLNLLSTSFTQIYESESFVAGIENEIFLLRNSIFRPIACSLESYLCEAFGYLLLPIWAEFTDGILRGS